ncbi:Hypothetical predicted protein [Paramuricea clavata]|uniref:Uncharacterized protein n=1 Tax=Paramuricea clavata TaxID=317549 RepID=A0A7D9DPG2_PARCT|nr:Hypothetical predicted protein [Paramuricea clavata]
MSVWRSIKNNSEFGHSEASYEAAMARLERKFEGQRRKIALYLEQLERLKPMQDKNPKELKKIAEIFNIVVVNLKEADCDEELGNVLCSLRNLTEKNSLNLYLFDFIAGLDL